MADDYEDYESKLKAIKQARETEAAIERCKFGIVNHGVIYKIAAETEYGTPHGGAERSVDAILTVEESAEVFEFVGVLLAKKLVTLRSALGL